MPIKITPEDKLFSDYIRTRDKWTCQRCFREYEPPTRALHCSHFFSRGNWSTRFDEENADAHCCGCHQYFEGNPHDFHVWKFEQLGESRYWELVRRANKDLKSLLGLSKKELRKIVKENYTKKLKELSHG